MPTPSSALPSASLPAPLPPNSSELASTSSAASQRASAPRAAPADAVAAADTAIGVVHASIYGAEPSRRPSPESVARALIAEQLKGNTAAVRTYLERHPDALQVLGNLPADDVFDLLRDAYTRALGGGPLASLQSFLSTTVPGAFGELETTLHGTIQNRVRERALEAVGNQLRALDQLRAELSEEPSVRLNELRNAQPGTSDAIFAELLHIQGDGGDRYRALQAIDIARDELEAFRADIRSGKMWNAADFPRSTAIVLTELGFAIGGRDSMAKEILGESVDPVEIVTWAKDITEGLSIASEVGQLIAEGVSAPVAASLSVGVGGLLFGLAIHHLAEEQHEAFVRTGIGLGL